jgi:hypothetical protein
LVGEIVIEGKTLVLAGRADPTCHVGLAEIDRFPKALAVRQIAARGAAENARMAMDIGMVPSKLALMLRMLGKMP